MFRFKQRRSSGTCDTAKIFGKRTVNLKLNILQLTRKVSSIKIQKNAFISTAPTASSEDLSFLKLNLTGHFKNRKKMLTNMRKESHILSSFHMIKGINPIKHCCEMALTFSRLKLKMPQWAVSRLTVGEEKITFGLKASAKINYNEVACVTGGRGHYKTMAISVV